MSQTVSNCKVEINQFIFEIPGWCRFSRGDRIGVIGNVDRRLIDMFLGQIRLNSAQIDKSDLEITSVVEMHNKPGFFQQLREKIRYKFRRILPSFEAGLVSGMIQGDKEGLTGESYRQMIESGTIHIVVASGYNVMLVAGTMMSSLLWMMKRSWATAVAMLGVWLYVLLAGGDPPVVRAAIMASVVMLGGVSGRKVVVWWVLVLAGWVMMVIEPMILIEPSFQLSMAASVGLMVVYPALMKWFDSKNIRLIELFDQFGLMTTVSTMMVTAPILWWHFQRFSLVSVASNLLVLPFVSVIMLLGVLSLVPGELTAPFLYASSHWVVTVIEFFARR